MDAYLRRVAALPRLDEASERALALRARSGDRQAREELITASLPLVLMRARRLGLRGQRLLDAMQAGTVGLIEAIDRFDPDRGTRLSSYAWWWIGRAISRARPAPEIAVGEVVGTAQWSSTIEAESLLDGMDAELVEVVAMRFGIGVMAGETLPRSQVARRLGLSVGQVRSRETKALSHLRKRLAKVGDRAPRDQRRADPP